MGTIIKIPKRKENETTFGIRLTIGAESEYIKIHDSSEGDTVEVIAPTIEDAIEQLSGYLTGFMIGAKLSNEAQTSRNGTVLSLR